MVRQELPFETETQELGEGPAASVSEQLQLKLGWEKPKIFTPEISAPHLPEVCDDLYRVNSKEGRFH